MCSPTHDHESEIVGRLFDGSGVYRCIDRRSGHQVFCVAVCDDERHTFTFTGADQLRAFLMHRLQAPDSDCAEDTA